MMKVSQREKRLLWITGLAVLLYLPVDLVILPWWNSRSEEAEKTRIQEKRLVNYQRILKDNGAFEDEFPRIRQQVADLEKELLDSDSNSLAGAEIQGLVRNMAIATGLVVHSTDLLAGQKVSDHYTKISTRILLRGSIDHLVSFLVALETGPKLLFLEDVQIDPTHQNVPKEKNIRATLTLSGLKYSEPVQSSENQS